MVWRKPMPQIDILKEKLERMGCAFLCEEPMSRHTSFHIGGPAELFITPADETQTAKALSLCRELVIAVHIIGNGSNLLVADEGLRGAVIAFSQPMSGIIRKGNTLSAQPGTTLAQLCRFAQQEGLSGLEFAWGIPGSVGGAVFMNAGAYGGEMKDVVTSVRVLNENGSICDVSQHQAGFVYRGSSFQKNGQVICSANFALASDSAEAIGARMKETLEKRVSKQPLEYPSAGSAFKRPPNGFAAALIDECGLKGFTVGGAQVSQKHAGFVINIGNATCRDVLMLLDSVKSEVYKHKGIMLEAEIKHLE